MRMPRPLTGLFIVSAFRCLSFSAFSQGSLTPPGPPTPTIKTLNQVEPRIPLDVAHIATAADSEFVIKNAGSYYLTGNLAVSKTNGIRVAVAGVTVDLNGFQVTRAGAPSGNGIVIDSVAHRCTIKHGTLSGFAAGTAVAQPRPRGGTFESLKATGNVTGLTGGDGWRLDHCIATDNNGLTTIGIAAGTGSAVVDCTSYDNGNIGFLAEAGTSFSRCIATGNGGVGFIDLSPDAVI